MGALACAGTSAALAGRAADGASEGLGELRPVVVTAIAMDRGTVIGRRETDRGFEERRVPAAFAPPDALAVRAEALGRRLATALPPGSYVTAAALASRPPAAPRAGPPRGTTPVEITVTGAGALQASRAGPGATVDVVVSGDPGPGPGAGRTYVAAERVALLDLREAPDDTGLASDRWVATLALRRDQALRLIRAESVAGSIRLLTR
jgi:hypothetical protein